MAAYGESWSTPDSTASWRRRHAQRRGRGARRADHRRLSARRAGRQRHLRGDDVAALARRAPDAGQLEASPGGWPRRGCWRRRRSAGAGVRGRRSTRWTPCASPLARSRCAADEPEAIVAQCSRHRGRLLAAAARAEPLAPRPDLGHGRELPLHAERGGAGRRDGSAASRPTSTPWSTTGSTPRRSRRA